MLNTIAPILAGEDGGYIILLLPDNYDMSAFSLNDVIAGIKENSAIGYSGEKLTIYESFREITLSGSEVIFGDPWTGTTGNYTILCSFFRDYNQTQIQSYGGTISISNVPAVISLGNIVLNTYILPPEEEEEEEEVDCEVFAEVSLSAPIAPILESENAEYQMTLFSMPGFNAVGAIQYPIDTGYSGGIINISGVEWLTLTPSPPLDPDNPWNPESGDYFLAIAFYRDFNPAGPYIPDYLYGPVPLTITLPCPIDIGSAVLNPC